MNIVYGCSFDLSGFSGKNRATRQKLRALENKADKLIVISSNFKKFKILELFISDLKAVYFLFKFVSIKYYFLVFLLITTLSILDILSKYITLIPGVIDHYSQILNATHYKVGFRFEFWAFTSIPIMLYFF
jgi:hypothetical protein